jgi:2,3-dihydroxyphenylpropionate 1,2-dioxygenase
VLINSAGAPLPTPARCLDIGDHVARAVRDYPEDLRVAVIGSGGLSHDPPIPSPESDNPEVVERAIHGKTTGFAASRERETALLAKIDTLNVRINAEWDRNVLAGFQSGTAAKLAANLTSESIYREAGNGGQEIRNWIAVAGAFDDRPFDLLYYEPIPALVTGMAVICRDTNDASGETARKGE